LDLLSLLHQEKSLEEYDMTVHGFECIGMFLDNPEQEMEIKFPISDQALMDLFIAYQFELGKELHKVFELPVCIAQSLANEDLQSHQICAVRS
jgi:hypothetical protein